MARLIMAVALMLWAQPVRAELQSLFAGGGAHPLASTAVALFTAPEPPEANSPGASLFAGPRLGLFAPLPPRPKPRLETAAARAGVPTLVGPTRAAHLLNLIARAEAGRAGYDAVQHGAKVRPLAAPTRMTLGQIDAWTRATPGQPHAIGRYQFIPKTLRRVAAQAGFGPEVRFSPAVQDRLAMVLLADAGLTAFEAGTLGRAQFMKNLARIWAGLPLPDGKSYYHGQAGNRATMTWASFEAGMARIWPVRG